MKKRFWLYPITFIGITGMVFLTNCFKKNDQPTEPILTTLPVSQITYCSAALGANVSNGYVEWGVCFDTVPNPIKNDNSPTNYEPFPLGTSGSYTITHSGLLENTTYYVRAYAGSYISLNGQLLPGYKMYYGPEVTFTTLKLDTIIKFNPNLTYGSLLDIDGNIYKTIQIGSQVWMAENLRVTKFRNGSNIQQIDKNWDDTDTLGAYCYFKNHSSYVTTFGLLYSYYAIVNSQKLCPTGWHVPDENEWTILETDLGGPSVAGGKLKESGTTHWLVPNDGATNESGFTALPGGNRYAGNYYLLGSYGYFLISSDFAYRFKMMQFSNGKMSNDEGLVYIDRSGDCYSVRCIKDD
jgi:uncharacterized protein (TIGR02145 family)